MESTRSLVACFILELTHHCNFNYIILRNVNGKPDRALRLLNQLEHTELINYYPQVHVHSLGTYLFKHSQSLSAQNLG